MIVLDSDLLIIDLRYPADARYSVNSAVLDALRLGPAPLVVTSQTLLEVIGVLSFNSPPSWTAELPSKLALWYAVQIAPDPATQPIFSGCAVAALVAIMSGRCSLGDALVVEQIRQFVPQASLLLSWNAKHFQGKLSIPALTPAEWWQQHQPHR